MNANIEKNRNLSRLKLALVATLAVSVLTVIKPPSSQAAVQSCPSFGAVQAVGNLTHGSIKEASGLVASLTYTNRFWLHNDSGDSARIFAMTGTGEDRGTVNLGGVTARDFEDIAIGPGPKSGKDYLYVADIGNNGHGRATMMIYRIEEPSPPGKGQTITIPGSKIEKFEYAYETPGNSSKTWRRNAEALIVDPRTGDLVIIEKQLNTVDGKKDMGWVYRITQGALKEGRVIHAKPVVAIRERRSTNYGPMTGADISPDGSLIIAKNGMESFAWRRGSGQSVFAALGSFPVSTCIPPGTPGEAIAFTANGSAFLSVKEAKNAEVRKVKINGGGGGGGGTPPPPPPPSGEQCDGHNATIVGTQGNDVIRGTSGRDVIVALGGNDVIHGLAGADIICGGPGRDRIYGEMGRDILQGGDGSDLIIGGRGPDFIVGAKGNDRLHGRGGADYLAGAVGDDTLVGGVDNDVLYAGDGTDTCKGGPGNDEYQGCE